jgi:hypothetical protein
MTTYALTETRDGAARVLRLRDFDDAPPLLPPEKGMEWVEWTETPAPAFDALTQGLRELDAMVRDGRACRVWEVYPLPDEVVAAGQTADVKRQEALLWAAADAWQTQFISGVAIGILTIGMLQAKPKALAVTAWTQRLWKDYYERKAKIVPGGQVDTDFSSIGPMPHSVPELQAELGL